MGLLMNLKQIKVSAKFKHYFSVLKAFRSTYAPLLSTYPTSANLLVYSTTSKCTLVEYVHFDVCFRTFDTTKIRSNITIFNEVELNGAFKVLKQKDLQPEWIEQAHKQTQEWTSKPYFYQKCK